jgi:hypothetical protein
MGGQKSPWAFFFCDRRRISATSRSGAVTPESPSVRNSTASASLIATWACSRIWRMKSEEPTERGVLPPWVGSMPPVSTILNARPFHSASANSRSRVVPGVSSTMASLSPARRLKTCSAHVGLLTRATGGLVLIASRMTREAERSLQVRQA